MIKKNNLDNKLSLLEKQKNSPIYTTQLTNINNDGSISSSDISFNFSEFRFKNKIVRKFLAAVVALSFLGSGSYAFSSLNIEKFMNNNLTHHEQTEFENKPTEINSQIHLKSNNNNNIIEKYMAMSVVNSNVFENKVLISSNDSSMIYPLTIENRDKQKKQSFLLKPDAVKTATVVKNDKKVSKSILTTNQSNLANAITEKYNIDKPSAVKIIKEAYNVGQKRNIDPEILLGITAVESGFNPKAKNRSGAIGLTQALPRAHPEKIGRVKKSGGSMYDIHTNLDVGAEIYGELLDKYNGNKILALQAYNGSVKDKKKRYSKKVMSAISTLKTMSLASNN